MNKQRAFIKLQLPDDSAWSVDPEQRPARIHTIQGPGQNGMSGAQARVPAGSLSLIEIMALGVLIKDHGLLV